MVIEFSEGKIIVTPHELVVRMQGKHMVALQAQRDAVALIGNGANVISVNGSECKWSMKLDNVDQLNALSIGLGVDIQQ